MLARIEQILRDLVPDFLDEILYEEDAQTPREERNNLNLTGVGSLQWCAERELVRPKPTYEYAKRLWVKQGMNVQPKRVLGMLGFETRNRSRNVVLRFDERPFNMRPTDKYFFGNGLTLYSEDKTMASESRQGLAMLVSERVFANDIFDWGYCCLGDEYDTNNIDQTGGGVRAVGIDVSRQLPGFYWANYFGPFLIEWISKAKLASVPGCSVEQLGHGVLVTNLCPPDEWESHDFRKNRATAMDHLGRDLFFEKGNEMKGRLFPIDEIGDESSSSVAE